MPLVHLKIVSDCVPSHTNGLSVLLVALRWVSPQHDKGLLVGILRHGGTGPIQIGPILINQVGARRYAKMLYLAAGVRAAKEPATSKFSASKFSASYMTTTENV